MLKERCRLLLKKVEQRKNCSCCMYLHNICIDHGDLYDGSDSDSDDSDSEDDLIMQYHYGGRH